ncbi:SH3 domain-containing protein [Streptomyces sp. NBC_01288]|uniref:SH3 domain-containing protein n=1 Tax=Streptomyces sp. NBC_01288 TaxID=2903814 RepID=UPI002E1391E8|nr:SH3 domain-containing protein [Streptomyces sp. NBC_01288]
MSLSLSLRRIGIAVAAGALVTAAAVAPAVADDEWGDEDPGVSRQDDGGWNQQGDEDFGGRGDHDNQGDHGDHGDHDNPRLYRGIVTAGQLALRSRPDRGSRIIRYAYRGEHVSIFCKTGGSNVQGNPLWYLLTDGTWAWGSARYIDNIGPAPRWC